MNPESQTVIALSITAIASGWLLNHGWKKLATRFIAKTNDSCGTGCGHCPVAGSAKGTRHRAS